MKKRPNLQVEELEQKNAPSCAGLDNALSSPGAVHHSDNATDHLQANVAVQCPQSPSSGGVHTLALVANHNETLVRDRRKRTKSRR
jgi:hypothetical protein